MATILMIVQTYFRASDAYNLKTNLVTPIFSRCFLCHFKMKLYDDFKKKFYEADFL